MAIETITIQDRRDKTTIGPAHCGDCWEVVEYRRIGTIEIRNGKSTGWKHIRTGNFECSPLCDICSEPATIALSRREWNGHTMRWENQAFVCTRCRDTHHIIIESKPRP